MEILTRALYDELAKKLSDIQASSEEINLESCVEEIFPEILSTLVLSVKENLMSNSKNMLDERRKSFAEFCQSNHKRWGDAFDLLETFIVICTEAGDLFNKANRSAAVEANDIVFDLSVRQHARACHIAQEILCLLKSGFSDGAHARWRALHEVTVTGMFIVKHGRECAERYYWYDITESYKGMLSHNRYQHRLQAKGPSESDLVECKQLYDDLIIKYGKEIGKPNGWAYGIIPDKHITFASIEKDVGLDHMRPYYKWASQNIHAGTKGINKKLSLCETSEDVLLVGQSTSGMTDPAHATAISLSQITATLLSTNINDDRVILLKIISEMVTEIGQVFLNCDRIVG